MPSPLVKRIKPTPATVAASDIVTCERNSKLDQEPVKEELLDTSPSTRVEANAHQGRGSPLGWRPFMIGDLSTGYGGFAQVKGLISLINWLNAVKMVCAHKSMPQMLRDIKCTS